MSFMPSPDSQFFVTGGTMDPESASYIVRRADTELLEALRNGELCHVLASRQMGKSSLMASTARRLTAEGVQCAIVDITIFSEKNGAADDWYYALVDHIADKLGLCFDTGAWWQENWRLPPLGRMTSFLDAVVLARCAGPVIIFVDEIDSTISLPFSDDFFAAIRACYNARATEPRFKRLNFVLLGVATPAQLIRDHTRTPFNVGRGVELTDFTPAEAAPLAAGLHVDRERATDLLARVLYWTGGHPYLTQILCWYLVRNSTWEIDEIVKDIFLSRRATREEPNLRLVRERLTQGAADLATVLHLYREIVTGQPVRDEPNSPVHASLRLSGVVKADASGELKVRNRIYQRVFSAEWVSLEIPAEPPAAPSAAPPEITDAYVTYDALRKLPEFRPLAAGVLARFCESRGLRDEALLVRIQALQESDSPANRQLVENLIDSDYRELVVSFVHGAPITAAKLSPNGNSLLTGSRDGVARLWSTTSGQPLLTPFRHRAPVTALAFSPCGKWLATGSDDHTAYVWNARTGERGVPLQHDARVRSVAFSADSQRLITTSADGTAAIWHTASGEPACVPLRQLDIIGMGAFSPDGSVVVTVSYDRTAVLWPMEFAGRFGIALLHEDSVTMVAFHPSGDAFVTASDDGKVRVWDSRSGLLLRSFAHGAPVRDLAISPDGTLLVAGGADGTARLWSWESAESPRLILRHHDSVLAVAFTPDGLTILTGSADRTMRLWNTYDGRPSGPPYRHYGKVISVACSPDALRVLTCDQEGAARLWRLSTQAAAVPPGERPAIVHPAEIHGAALSFDGTRVASGGADNTARIWTANGEPAAPPLVHPAPVSALAFDPTGAVLATGCDDGGVRLWDAASGKALDARFDHRAAVRVLAFSPDGGRLASGSDDQTARVWDLGRMSAGPLLRHRGWVRTLAYSPDATQLLTGGFDRTACLWSLDSGKPVGDALEHASAVSSVGFQPRSDGLLVSCAVKSVYFWRMKTDGDNIAPAIAFTLQFADLVQHAAFAPRSGRLLVITRSWAYYYRLDESGPVLISSRLLAGPWIGAVRWREEPDALDLCQLDAGDSLRVDRLSLDPPDVAPILGETEELLSKWQWRLGLHITGDSRLLPAF